MDRIVLMYRYCVVDILNIVNDGLLVDVVSVLVWCVLSRGGYRFVRRVVSLRWPGCILGLVSLAFCSSINIFCC